MDLGRAIKAGLVGAALTLLPAGLSQAKPPAKPAAKPAPAASSRIDPRAVQALARMSTFLKTNPTFQVISTLQRDEVDAYGQTVTFTGRTIYSVRAPNAFTVQVADRDGVRLYVYNGKSMVVYDPTTKYYARFDAPPTIRQTLDLAQAKYGITVPLDDLFHWDEGDRYIKRLTSAHFVGGENVGGQNTAHYAYRQRGVDWQIWIAAGARPLPVRVVIVAADDPAKPRFQADLAWNTDPRFAANAFAFTPPPGARSIPIVASAQ